MSDLYFGYIHNVYPDKQESIDDMYCQYIKALINDIYHHALLQ